MTNINNLKAKYKELGKEIEALEKKEIDFSEFVGRCGDGLAIKGEKLLKSLTDGEISYSNNAIELYNDKLNYIETTLDKLDKGDVFIEVGDVENMRLEYFKIFAGKDKGNNFIFQHLCDYDGIEIIDRDCYFYEDTKVIKFLRD